MTATIEHLKALESLIGSLAPSKLQELAENPLVKAGLAKRWRPWPGPQTEGYTCQADELYYGGEAGGGKALALSTPLPTPSGWTTMGEVKVGDTLFSDHGEPCRVTAVSPVMFGHRCYRVVFSDGAEIVADAEHRWLTASVKERGKVLRQSAEWKARRRASRPSRAKTNPLNPWTVAGLTARNKARAGEVRAETASASVRTTLEIAATLKDGHHYNHAVAVATPLRCEPASLPVDPYVLGAWLGDGTSRASSITTTDVEILDAVAQAGFGISVRPYQPITYGVTGGLQTALRRIRVLGNKHVPPAYLRAAQDQRLALLQGLMDTDGTAGKDGHCSFTTTRKEIAEGIRELLVTLGIKAPIRSGWAKLRGRIVSPKYTVKFRTELPVFRLPRKLIRQKRGGFRGVHRQRYIVAVEQVASEPVKCVAVDSASRLYLAGRDMVPTHNTDLVVGLALTEHRRSLVLRRTNVEATKLVERFAEVIGSRAGWNGQDDIWRTDDDRVIDIRGCQHEDDKQKYKGTPHDLIAFDEITDFTETQYRFIIGWNRSADKGQRCRVVATGNPPTTAEGLWVLKYWGPWVDPTHPNPAKPGELRWFTTIDGKDTEVDGPGPHMVNGEPIIARSRTFIRARLADNPGLSETNYASVLAALPAELRAAYKEGRFDASYRDHEWQVIPTAWIREAQARWTPDGWRGLMMTAIGVDVAQGGGDSSTLAPRYGTWYAPLQEKPGSETPDTPSMVGFIVAHQRDGAGLVIDIGGGWGVGPANFLKENGAAVTPFDGSKPSTAKTQGGRLGFFNKRAEVWWRFREALDPGQEGGSPLALPVDPALLADLTAPHYEVTPRGIKVEPKEDIKKRLGRSPDKGDAAVMSWSEGQALAIRSMTKGNNRAGRVTVNIGHAGLKARRR